MNNPSDIKDVQIKDRNGEVKALLWYDPATKQVKMDPMDVSNITMRDFTRIHSFWRRVQAMRYAMQGGQ
jgi:hypothetical protein